MGSTLLLEAFQDGRDGINTLSFTYIGDTHSEAAQSMPQASDAVGTSKIPTTPPRT